MAWESNGSKGDFCFPFDRAENTAIFLNFPIPTLREL